VTLSTGTKYMNQQNLITKNNFSIEPFHTASIPTKDFKSTGIERKKHLQSICKLPMIEGEILEFGVFQGKTIKHLSKGFPNKTLWGFDSFEGLPEDWFLNAGDIVSPRPAGYFALDNLPEVPVNVRLVKGFFDQSLPRWLRENPINQISILHIDCDLYSSTKTIFDLLNSYIVEGTIIVFDEFYPWSGMEKYDLWEQGEYRALKEWVEQYDRSFEVIYRNRHQQCSIRIVK
jgi:hypothetical protein